MRHRSRCASLLAALTLASCGGSTKTVTTTVSSAPTSTTTAVSTATTTSAPTTTRTTSSGPVAVPHCRAAMLSLSFLAQQGATGHGELGFALRNISAGSCRTFGYPGVLFLGRSGQSLPTVSTRSTHDLLGVSPLVGLVVAPGTSVSFRLQVSHGIASPAGCLTAYGLQVIPPDDTATLRTTIAEGAYYCRTAIVSPVRPGNSAYP